MRFMLSLCFFFSYIYPYRTPGSTSAFNEVHVVLVVFFLVIFTLTEHLAPLLPLNDVHVVLVVFF